MVYGLILGIEMWGVKDSPDVWIGEYHTFLTLWEVGCQSYPHSSKLKGFRNDQWLV